MKNLLTVSTIALGLVLATTCANAQTASKAKAAAKAPNHEAMMKEGHVHGRPARVHLRLLRFQASPRRESGRGEIARPPLHGVTALDHTPVQRASCRDVFAIPHRAALVSATAA